MTINIKTLLCIAAISLAAVAGPTQATTETEIVGRYSTNNEKDFNFDLKIEKGGKATWTEFDSTGRGKPFVMIGTWKLEGSSLSIKFPKDGSYTYTVTETLTWADFGCKGASFGFGIASTPKGKPMSSDYNVFRKADLKKTAGCQPI